MQAETLPAFRELCRSAKPCVSPLKLKKTAFSWVKVDIRIFFPIFLWEAENQIPGRRELKVNNAWQLFQWCINSGG